MLVLMTLCDLERHNFSGRSLGLLIPFEMSLSLPLSLSLTPFNGHFPGGPGLAGVY